MTIQLAVFDMAGTTVDERNVVYRSVQQAINEAGFEATLPQVLLHAAGKEKRQAIRDTLAALHGQTPADSTVQPIFEHFQRILDEAYQRETFTPQPGATDLFAYLKAKNIRVALNTGYARPVAERLVAQMGWAGSPLLDLVVTADDVPQGRPAPDMIHFAMRQLGIGDAAAVLKVGDSIVDIEEGKNAGCGLVFGISTGAQTREQLLTANPSAVLDHLAEIMDWVDGG
jgi:phosphonatase-like hydrolase